MSDAFARHEPEVRKAKVRAGWKALKDALGPVTLGILAALMLGLVLGSCVAGFMIPIKLVGYWLG